MMELVDTLATAFDFSLAGRIAANFTNKASERIENATRGKLVEHQVGVLVVVFLPDKRRLRGNLLLC